MIVPLSQPDITELEIEAVTAVLRSPTLSLGPKMEAFEQRMAALTNLHHGIAASSGTAGLHLCVRALGIGAGDEVLVPSFTFIAAANVIRYESATPVFVDIDPRTLNLDPDRLAAAITPRTCAIMVVHSFGRPANMAPILELARRHNLRIVEDACEAIGATWQGQPVGSFGDAAVFAFYPNKQITTGEGGMIVTRSADLASTCRALRNQGRVPSDAWHQHTLLGFNYRLSEIQCALGVAQLQRLDSILARRAAAAALYAELLRDVSSLLLPEPPDRGDTISWFVYVVRLAGTPGVRDRILEALAGDGIQCGRYFAPIHQQPAYARVAVMHPLTVTEAESQRTLALPFFTNITPAQIGFVADRLRHALEVEAKHSQ